MTLKVTRENLADGSLRARWRDGAVPNGHERMRTDAEMAEILEEILSQHDPEQDLWVFGYGSLIWNPAFEHIEQRQAVLHGWHRRFCLKLFMGRGTPETPGLMLALDHGGACKGVAFRIAAPKVREELGILWQREMFGGSYLARWVNLDAGGERLRAVAFVINRKHPRYTKELSIEQTAAMIETGCGVMGSCREYLENTVAHLRQLGLRDAALARIVAALRKRERSAS